MRKSLGFDFQKPIGLQAHLGSFRALWALLQGWPVTLHDYRTMECYCECNIESIEPTQDPAVRERFKELAAKYNVRDLEEAKLCTISCDVEWVPDAHWNLS